VSLLPSLAKNHIRLLPKYRQCRLVIVCVVGQTVNDDDLIFGCDGGLVELGQFFHDLFAAG